MVFAPASLILTNCNLPIIWALYCKESLVLNFDNLTERLVEELKAAAMHFDLYRSIKASIPSHKKGINKSPNFWSLTLNAHLEATRCSLCKIYEQTNNNNLTLGLKNSKNTIVNRSSLRLMRWINLTEFLWSRAK